MLRYYTTPWWSQTSDRVTLLKWRIEANHETRPCILQCAVLVFCMSFPVVCYACLDEFSIFPVSTCRCPQHARPAWFCRYENIACLTYDVNRQACPDLSYQHVSCAVLCSHPVAKKARKGIAMHVVHGHVKERCKWHDSGFPIGKQLANERSDSNLYIWDHFGLRSLQTVVSTAGDHIPFYFLSKP